MWAKEAQTHKIPGKGAWLWRAGRSLETFDRCRLGWAVALSLALSCCTSFGWTGCLSAQGHHRLRAPSASSPSCDPGRVTPELTIQSQDTAEDCTAGSGEKEWPRAPAPAPAYLPSDSEGSGAPRTPFKTSGFGWPRRGAVSGS